MCGGRSSTLHSCNSSDQSTYYSPQCGIAASYLEHLPDLIRVHVQVLAWVDCDHGWSSVGLYEVVDISLSQSVKDRALVQIPNQSQRWVRHCLRLQYSHLSWARSSTRSNDGGLAFSTSSSSTSTTSEL